MYTTREEVFSHTRHWMIEQEPMKEYFSLIYVINYFCFNLAKLIYSNRKNNKIFEFSIQKSGLF